MEKMRYQNHKEIRIGIIITLIQFLLWLPVFLAYYPGIYTYDVLWQMLQGSYVNYNTHYPLVHTLWLQFFYNIVGAKWLGNYNAGIAISTLLQMLFFSFCLSYVYLFFKKINTRRSICALWVILFGMFPLFPLMAISSTKDIFFSGIFVVLFVSICMDIVDEKYFADHKMSQIIYVTSIAGVILLRNNGIYPVLFLVIVYVIRYVKNNDSCRLKKTIFGIVVGMCISTALQNGLKAEKGSINEALSLPYQQLACAYRDHRDKMTQGEIENIIYFIPDVEQYNPRISDNVKNSGQASSDIKNFIYMYIKEGLHFPKSYLKAFYELDIDYLNPLDTSLARIYETDELRGIIPTGIVDGMQVERQSLFPNLEKVYDRLFRENEYEKSMLLKIGLSPAIYLWVIIVVAFIALLQKNRRMIALIGYLAVYILTLLAGPCVLLRYALPYILCVPAIVACSIWNYRNAI